jgi:hypothetical protein
MMASKAYEREVRAAMKRLARNPVDMTKLDVHRLTWKGWHAVSVLAGSKEEAISKALKDKPAHIPAGTELYYGAAGGTPVGVAA